MRFSTLFVGMGEIQAAEPRLVESDVCVYAATPSGILAAVVARQQGRTVVVVEPSRWVGGILGAGLKPLQDCPNIHATGGLTRSLIETLGTGAPPLKSQARALNPAAIREDFVKLLKEHDITVIYSHRIGRTHKEGAKMVSASFDLAPFDETGCPPAKAEVSGHLQVQARVFIDASYEGELMAASGVSYRTGREGESEYGEPAAGVQPPGNLTPLDPFVVPGDRASGLLPWVEADHGHSLGAGDHHTQAYNYRYYTTIDPAHRVPFGLYEGYDPAQYELVGRYVEHLVQHHKDPAVLRRQLVGIFPGWMNAGDWNYQRQSLISLAPLGISHLYASGDQAQKAAIWKEHQRYLQGMHRFMSTDERVPESYRREVAAIGLDQRAHPETQGWPHQLYIRVSRRLVGGYTITAHDVYNQTKVKDPIALAQYGIDTYPSRRYWMEQEGRVMVGNEGNMFVGGDRGPTNVPYPIPYDAIVPEAEECSNLIVPVCFSATHLGYASARMEPVFMMCGEAAGLAASHAIAQDCSVQAIDRSAYGEALIAAGHKLSWDPEKDASERPAPYRRGEGDSFSFETLLLQADGNGDKLVSAVEWGDSKGDFVWLFPLIDQNGDERIDAVEYAAFQTFKKQHRNWLELAREATSREP